MRSAKVPVSTALKTAQQQGYPLVVERRRRKRAKQQIQNSEGTLVGIGVRSSLAFDPRSKWAENPG